MTSGPPARRWVSQELLETPDNRKAVADFKQCMQARAQHVQELLQKIPSSLFFEKQPQGTGSHKERPRLALFTGGRSGFMWMRRLGPSRITMLNECLVAESLSE